MSHHTQQLHRSRVSARSGNHAGCGNQIPIYKASAEITRCSRPSKLAPSGRCHRNQRRRNQRRQGLSGRMRAAASPGGGRARASLPVKMLLSAWARHGQQWPPQPVAAWPTWPHPLRCTVPNLLYRARPPPVVAAGPAASWCGGRCHVSPAAPAATSEGVLFDVFICR